MGLQDLRDCNPKLAPGCGFKAPGHRLAATGYFIFAWIASISSMILFIRATNA
jgi:hypothetical protein